MIRSMWKEERGYRKKEEGKEYKQRIRRRRRITSD